MIFAFSIKLEVMDSPSYITESARGFANSLELHFTLIALKFLSAVFQPFLMAPVTLFCPFT